VRYGELVDIGRHIVEQRVERPAAERAARWALKEGMTSPLFAPALKLGQLARPLLPAVLRDKVPRQADAAAHRWPTRTHPRKVLLLMGCVQPTLMPNINSATARVLDACGIQTLVAGDAGCCGALRTHLADRDGGLADMRRNIDAWWPLVDGLTAAGRVEAIVMNASGCGVMVKEYGHALAHDPAYSAKARRIGELTRDLSELLPELVPKLKARLHKAPARRLAYHAPCTLQHGQQLRGHVEAAFRELGFEIDAPQESHLCCGSAGTYSVLQPELAHRLRDRKLENLSALQPSTIVSANIGCIQHLQSGTTTPVRHWVEVLDQALSG